MATRPNIYLVPAYGVRTQAHRERLGTPIGPYWPDDEEAIARGIDTLHEMYAGFGYIIRVEGAYFPETAAREAKGHVDHDWFRWCAAHDGHECVDATNINVAVVLSPGIFALSVHNPEGATL